MSIADLELLCLVGALASWYRAIYQFHRVRRFSGSTIPVELVQYFQGTCRAHWAFIRGIILVLPFQAWAALHHQTELWRPIALTLVAICIGLLWRSDRRRGQRLIDEADEDVMDMINNPLP